MFVRLKQNVSAMNVSKVFQFLRDIQTHNNRDWFHAHKDEYKAACLEFENVLTEIITRISFFDKSVRGIEARDCTYRIHRDLRFSQDKTPYKTHFGGYINAKGKKSNHCGYYVHIEPGNCMLAGGSLCLPPHILKAVRQSIYDNIEEYISIVEDPAFKKFFPTVGEDPIKTALKGFPKDFPYIDYLKCRQFVCDCHVSDDFFSADNAPDQIGEIFRQFKRFADFLNYTIDDYE